MEVDDLHANTTCWKWISRNHNNTLWGKHRLASEMTPALRLVLLHLLNEGADISWDWKRAEAKVILNELKQVIVQSVGAPVWTGFWLSGRFQFRLMTHQVNRFQFPLQTSMRT
jgi:hypothetical protein